MVAVDTNYIIFKNVEIFKPNKIQIAIEKIEKYILNLHKNITFVEMRISKLLINY
jgi:hypothetical protein